MAPDGFGTRISSVDESGGDEVERLDLAPQLVEHSGFVAALGERVARLAAVKHASYVHLRRLDRPSTDRLELVSDLTPGWRLSELLQESSAADIAMDITVVIGLLRQLLPAVALYGRNNRDAAIGSLAVERIIVTPQARLVIAEHAFGPAIEKLNLGRDRLWRELRVAMPPSAGLPRSNQRADANAIGVVALSLLLGRVLELEEFPAELPSLVDGIQEHRNGEASPLSATFSNWLKRALQFDVRAAFQAPSEAQVAFESVLASDRSYVTSSAKLEEWVRMVGGAIESKRRPPEPEPAASPEPLPPPEPEPDPYVASEAEPIVASTPAVTGELESERQPAAEPIVEAESAVAREETPERSTDRADASEVRQGERSRMPLMLMAGMIALLIVVVLWMWSRTPAGPRAGEGALVVESRPQGATVTVDGSKRGVTPLTITLKSGAHVLEVQIGKSEPRVIPLTIQANVQTAQYIELQGVQATGSLEIKSEPSGAKVVIDGQPRGSTPGTIRDLSAGDHAVVLELGTRKVMQTVKIDAGSTAQLVVPIPRR